MFLQAVKKLTMELGRACVTSNVEATASDFESALSEFSGDPRDFEACLNAPGFRELTYALSQLSAKSKLEYWKQLQGSVDSFSFNRDRPLSNHAALAGVSKALAWLIDTLLFGLQQ